MSLADTCRMLAYQDVPNAVGKWLARIGVEKTILLPDEQKSQNRGRPSIYERWFVLDPEFDQVVLQSAMPNSSAAVSWVCGEVLPCIRQYGCYLEPDD